MTTHNSYLAVDQVLQSGATGTGAGSPMPVGGLNWVCLEVTGGSFAGTIVPQIEVDGTYYNVFAVNVTTGAAIPPGTGITAQGIYCVPVSGADQLQANITAYSNGPVTVTAKAGTGPPPWLLLALQSGTLGAVSQGSAAGVGSAWPVKKTDGTNTQPLQSAANLAAGTNGNGAGVVTPPGNWTQTHAPAVATQATKSQAAGGAGVKNVCTWVSFTLANDATGTEQPLIQVNLRDGATGAGTVLASWTLALPATPGESRTFSLSGLCIPGSANTPMTLETSAAPAAHTAASVAFGGFTAS